MNKYRINYTVFKNWSCTKFVTGEDEPAARKKFIEMITSEPFEDKEVKKKDLVIDSFEDVTPKKGKKRR